MDYFTCPKIILSLMSSSFASDEVMFSARNWTQVTAGDLGGASERMLLIL